MNEILENNVAITSLRNFYMNYRKPILLIIGAILVLVSANLINNQIKNINNVQAAEIYNKWIAQETDTEEGKLLSDELFDDLINSYKKTGYANIALLNQASLKAKNGDLELALNYFLALKDNTKGIGGNDLFSKIASINAARIMYAQENYDKALQILEEYSSSNASIHELVGDILYKQGKLDLAKDQYNLAKEKYTDNASISIISMKISNLTT
ncbi:tetratricopeptide repeat protein [Gammaproteobacteria bacterium]|nr:tetratricopeptide repeat protein [Gammaproteobacteria bacterium]